MAEAVPTVPRLIFDFASVDVATPTRFVFERPTEILEAYRVGEVRAVLERVDRACRDGSWAAGFLAYEAAPAFDAAFQTRPAGRMPLAWFGVFDGPSDGSDGRRAAADGTSRSASADAVQAGADTHASPDIEWRPDIARDDYDAAFAAIRAAIERGETYQVNFSFRLRGRFRGEPIGLYRRFAAAQGPGRHALLELGRFTIVSASPELFFDRADDRIVSKPMKGTAPRGRFLEEDDSAARRLARSEKERAENLMIVDLLRNDIGRVARTGSVHVPALHDVERYRTVHQMTSTVAAEVDPATPLADVFAALFPCGSVTGAPKIQTMRIIAALERSPREAYCGAIGFVRPGGDCTFSVPIRTAWIDHDASTIEYGVGGGITWDSTPDAEYHETTAKAALLAERWADFELLETLRAEDGCCARLDRHLARMRDSARYFGFPFDAGRAARILTDAARASAQPVRLRLRLAHDGTFALDHAGDPGPFAPSPDIAGPDRFATHVPVALCADPVRADDRFLFHKTTNRGVYDRRRAQHPHCFDVLLQNADGQLTEFTTGNLVVERDGRLYTPPRTAGLLAGTLRAEMLEAGIIAERDLTARDIADGPRAWLLNSVRGWVPVRFVTSPRETL